MENSFAVFGEAMTCRHEAWEVALDRVELDVIRVERAVESGLELTRVDEWRVPDDYGPIPLVLRPRAEEILARQRELVERICQRLGVTMQHQAIVEGVARVSTRGPEMAVYIDVDA